MKMILECIVIVPESCSDFFLAPASALLLAPASAHGHFWYSGEKMKMIFDCIVIVPESCLAVLLAPTSAFLMAHG